MRPERPTRPRIWYSCARPMRSASSMMRVLQLRTSMPVSMRVVQTRMSISPFSRCCHTGFSSSSVILSPHPVVQVVHLPAPGKLLLHGFGKDNIVVFQH